MDKKSNELIVKLKEFKQNTWNKIILDKIILFGSRAKGTAKKNSDVDLILVSKDFKGEKSFKRPAQFYVDWNYDYDVDIICLTPQELERKKKQIGLIKNALKEGIIIK